MVSITRKLLLFSMIAAFAVTVPVVLLSTAGYRFNSLKNRIEKTGIIEAQSVPSGATVYLNDERQDSVTPASLHRLLPEDYEVSLSLNGYYDWTKKLTVEPGRTTFTTPVVLVRDILPSLIEPGDFTDGTWSPDRLRMAAMRRQAGWQEIVVWNRPQRTLSVLARNPIDEDSADSINWSPDGQKLLHLHVADGRTAAVIHAPGTARDPVTVSSLLPADLYAAKWSSDNQKIVFVGSTGAFLVTGDGESASPIVVANDVLDAVARDSGALVLRRSESGERTLEKIDWPSGQPTNVAMLPEGVDRIVEWNGSSVIVADSRHGRMTSVGINSQARAETGGSNFVRWRQDSQVISWSEFEVFIGDLATGESELVTRLAEPITDCVWHPSGTVIVCATDKRVFATETDGRNGRNSWQLAWGEGISGLAADDIGNRIYFIATIGQAKGIFERSL